MNKVILSWKDYETLLKWHDRNKNLVYSYPEQLKNVTVIIKESLLEWKGEITRKNNKVKIHYVIDGKNH